VTDVADRPAAAVVSVRGRTFSLAELLVAVSGVLMLIVGFLPWYGYDADGWHPRYSAFQAGGLAFFPVLFAVVVAGTTTVSTWSGSGLPRFASDRFTWMHVFCGLDLLAAVLVAAFWLTIPPLGGASVGVSFGTYAGLVLALAQAAGCLWAVRDGRDT
jgi:type III secretory pathway component EscS